MKIYYINLDQSTERRDWMESQLSVLAGDDIQYQRIAAIDGSKLSAEEITTHTHSLSPNQLGCSLSHRRAWELIGTGADEYGVVMEDDILISSLAREFLNNDQWIPPCTGILRLETTNSKIRLLSRKGGGIKNNLKYELCEFLFNYGSGAYVIHRDVAKYLQNKYNKIPKPVDLELNDPELFQGEKPLHGQHIIRLQIDPGLAIQQHCYKRRFLPANAEVSIMADYSQKTVFNQNKLGRELHRLTDLQQWGKAFSKLFSLPFVHKYPKRKVIPFAE